jgi:hypothetical protein
MSDPSEGQSQVAIIIAFRQEKPYNSGSMRLVFIPNQGKICTYSAKS